MKVKKCETKYCRKTQAPKRKYCYSCIKRSYANRHPMKYAFNTLKQNAKRRGKSFELTFDQFKKFAIKTNYMAGRGIEKDSFHIDRIDPERGYCVDNIRVLTNSENVKRHRKYLKHEFGPDGKQNFHVHQSMQADESHSDLPF